VVSALPLVLGVTGASGAPYGVRLVAALVRAGVPLQLIISRHGWRLLEMEAGVGDLAALREQIGGDWSKVEIFENDDRGATPASGSARTRGMVVCPCSMGTLAAIAQGHSRSLIERAADVTLKERRRLVLVPRETPLSLVHLRNMLAVTRAGAVVMPAAPGFYHRPPSVDALVDFIVARILDHLGVEHTLTTRWRSGGSDAG
jgi:4-hydroxy-3-polyprenylbenzoate decarboxylase